MSEIKYLLQQFRYGAQYWLPENVTSNVCVMADDYLSVKTELCARLSFGCDLQGRNQSWD